MLDAHTHTHIFRNNSSDVGDDYYVRGLYGFGVLCVLLGVK